jgi:hypothetical protein
VACDWPVLVKTGIFSSVKAKAIDVSYGGMRLSCEREFVIGQVFTCVVHFPDGTRTSVRARAMCSSVKRGTGVMFIFKNKDDDHQHTIAEQIARLIRGDEKP